MPALYTHLRFGDSVKRTLPPAYQAVIENYPEAFALGTQGPDILLYHRPLKKNELRSLGSALHDYSGNRFFLEQAKKLLAFEKDLESLFSENGAYCAYLCGFLCHFTLDALCHAYVEKYSNKELSHCKMESEWDKVWLREDNKSIRGYNAANPILDKNGTKEAVCTALDVKPEPVARSIKSMRKINRLFSLKCEAFHAFAHLVLRVAGMERTFGDMFLHKKDDPLFAPHCERLNELFFSSIPQASALIQEFFENLSDFVKNGKLNNELFRYDFSGIIHTEET